MDPSTVAKLHKVPEFKEVVAFLMAELANCDSLDGLAELSFTERAYEATARLRAKERLEAILAPLINTQELSTGVNLSEYAA